MEKNRGETMLGMHEEVYRGILFLRMRGDFTRRSVSPFEKKLEFLLHHQGMHYFVFNFEEVHHFDKIGISIFEKQVDEILLECGKVAICGLDHFKRNTLFHHENLYFVQNEWDACNYLYL